ncbi:hypothetical protein TNCV_3669471 [Trichonephila clavipes]|nr:hypothetical protein TNCV_3669471 [Trichonephila clavipes]
MRESIMYVKDDESIGAEKGIQCIRLDVTILKPCPDHSPNQNALNIASGTEPTLIRKEDTTPLTVVQFLCSLRHCKRSRRWSTFNGRQRLGRWANWPPL